MERRWRPRGGLRGFVVAALIMCSAQAGLGQEPASSAKGYRPIPSTNKPSDVTPLPLGAPAQSKVVVIAIDRTVELGLAAFVRRAIGDNPDAAAFVFEINTLGGRVDAAIQIRDAILEAEQRTVAFINPRAISAGALIALACDNIVMTDGATIGAATPVQVGSGEVEAAGEKMVSYMRAEMRATAEANGRRGEIAEAMVDREVIIDDVVEPGKLLTLDTDQALKLGIADAEAVNLDDVMGLLQLEDPQTQSSKLNWGEEVARWLTEPTVSGLLLSVGMLGLMIAFYTRTVGPFTVAGLVALGLFFGGHAVVHLVGWEEAVLFAVGVILILVEIFFVPGFGVPGVVGFVCLLAALVMAMIGIPLDVSFGTGVLASAMTRVMLSLLGALALALLFARLLPKTSLGHRLILEEAETGFTSATTASTTLIGSFATALTDLRPTGKITIGVARHDAKSERAFIARGTRVRVIATDGPTLVVRVAEETE